MQGIQLDNCEIGTVASRVDGSVAFRVITAELRQSERGLVMEFHGKAATVIIKPHNDEAPEMVVVNTERDRKTPGQRLRAILFLLHRKNSEGLEFERFYERKMDAICEKLKEKLT